MSHSKQLSIAITLPDWAEGCMLHDQCAYTSLESRMQLAISLARMNIEHGTGGPFGAAIFDMDNHQLLAVGMNLVVASHCSMAHAEMVAISIAQQQRGAFDLGQGAERYELITSCEPCAMCFGAIPWSGIRHLVCGARAEDARAIGFDEGPKMADWQGALEQRGITLETDVCREQAVELFRSYAASSGAIYNGRQGG